MSTLPSEVLEQLLALSRRLTSHRDLDSVLQDLLEGSLRLIAGSDFACVFLYDAEENALIPVGGVGFDMQYMQHVHLKPGESMTGQAFIQKKPLLLAEPHDVQRAQRSLSPENDKMVRLAVGRPTNPVRSSLAIPLIVGDRTVGVLVIDNYDTDRDFDSTDLRIGSALADHAAVAVANAQDYQLAQSLSQDLKATLSVQHKLLRSILSPTSGFGDILRTLGSVVHRSLAVIAADGTIIARHGRPDGPSKNYPVRAGATVFGQLAVGGGALSRGEVNAVEQALPVIALEFVKGHLLRQEQERLHVDLVQRILDNDLSAIHEAEHAYPLIQADWCAFVLDRVDGPAIDALCDTLTAAPVFSARIDSGQAIIASADDQVRIADWARHHDAMLVVGDVCRGVENLSAQLRGISALWDAIQYRAPYLVTVSREFFLRDFPAYTLLPWVSERQRHRYAQSVLGPLLDDPDSLNTLTVWLLLGRSYAKTAGVLHAHPNTIRYRIGRLAELLARDLADDQAISALRLAVLWADAAESV